MASGRKMAENVGDSDRKYLGSLRRPFQDYGIYFHWSSIVDESSLGESMNGLGQAIQLENDRFLICHANKSFDRVCIIDNTGNVIKINNRNYSKRVGKLNFPSHLAVDRKGFIFVVDRNNDRIVQLNSSLEFIREVIP